MASYKKETGIIIPAFNPDEKMVTLVGHLHAHGFEHIIIVDDGSNTENKTFFETSEKQYHCHIIRHVVNFGKGMALKSAFNYVLDRLPDIKGVVTVDCDGQHTLEDTIALAKLTLENPDKLIMGCRQFSNKSIPFRSRFGNKLTCLTIRLLCGIRVSDSQTGLRGMSSSFIRDYFGNTKGERFEYEMNMLIKAKECQIPILELPIQTIYLENNETSHFNPFIDSIRIYKLFFKFLLSSLSAYMIDIAFFYLFAKIFHPSFPDSYIYIATILARCISSFYNFTMNKNQVFKNNSKSPSILLKYYTLCVAQTLISAYSVSYVYKMIAINESVLKSCIEVFLFLISFQIQRKWVFTPSSSNQNSTPLP